jgi:hypothetical protein
VGRRMKLYSLRTLLIILLSSLLSCDYREFKLLEENEIPSAFILNSSPTFEGYYYEGSDSLYHYFESKWKYQVDRKFKLLKSDLSITREFLIEEAREVRIDVYKLKGGNFGSNQYYNLYLIE